MTARHSNLIIKRLKQLGFIESETHHKQYVYYTLAGIKTRVKTHISHGSKDYGDNLLSRVAEQLKLTKKELLRLIDDEMTREDYEKILKNKGFID